METKIVPGISHDDLMAIALEDILPERGVGADGKPSGITAKEFSEEASIAFSTAQLRLRTLEENGVFISLQVKGANGTPLSVYYKKEKE